MKGNEAEALKKVRERYEQEFINEKNIYFLVRPTNGMYVEQKIRL